MADLPTDDSSAVRMQRGLQVLKELGWGDASVMKKEVSETFFNYTVPNFFGTVWCRPVLSLRDREMISMAAMIAMDRKDGMVAHFRTCHNVGISEEELIEMIFQMMYNGGWSVGVSAFKCLEQARRDRAAGVVQQAEDEARAARDANDG